MRSVDSPAARWRDATCSSAWPRTFRSSRLPVRVQQRLRQRHQLRVVAVARDRLVHAATAEDVVAVQMHLEVRAHPLDVEREHGLRVGCLTGASKLTRYQTDPS